ncbi:hypothetical protein BTO06_05250 [Tenacibaculum sp. SZ-18]|uniref:glycosyltransferase family 2 protein n=1 Tax=Tenacibaculum sp. SZ-18 TaxID=754423 RepID=UPI000C2CFCE3|nr:glycosyltransferase family 2 protein [Tenacibaculum sp. SZ-18]AUC14578.1 hypothetical protein BTO06_05250 [Tenacibaculum sp. SZ-18]
MNSTFYDHKIAIVIPYYNASKQITRVVSKIPNWIASVIIIDDCGNEILPENKVREALADQIDFIILKNDRNLGVGGATKKGFKYAIDNYLDIVIKVDADDQMDLNYLPNLLKPLIENKSLISKGNRFKDLKALRNMPTARKFGNLGLSFLMKVATGYWHNFDPTNGFLAIKIEILREIDFSKLHNRYYFETSLLAELYFQEAKIIDIPMPAIYGDEKSNMNIFKMFFSFSKNLTVTFGKRIIKRYFLYDFNIGSLYLLTGLPLFIFGIVFGIKTWIESYLTNTFTPTGTIMIITLSLILGFQLLLQAVQVDILNAPNNK